MTGRHFTRSKTLAALRHGLFAAATMTSLIAGATAAHAGYYVATSANTGRGYNRGCAAQYNYGGTGASFINNDGGGSTCDPAAYASFQTVTVSGTTDTIGNLTAAYDTSSVTAGTDAAYARSSADLATGQLHLFASATGFSDSYAQGRLVDTLHFTVAGASADTVTLIPVSFSFDGTIPGTSDPNIAQGELTYGFYFGNASTYEYGDYGAGYYGYYGNNPTFAYASPARVGGWNSSSFASYDPLNTQFTGYYAITGATADIPVDFSVGLHAYNVALDYSNTAQLSIGHVDGVSFTSDSGVFLSAAAPVPEPASWAMMVAGIGLVGAAARGRRSRGTAGVGAVAA